MEQFDADAKRMVDSGKLSASSIKAITDLAIKNMEVCGQLRRENAYQISTLSTARRAHGLLSLPLAQEGQAQPQALGALRD
jgi:hypothetical protein